MKCEWKSILAKDFIEFNPKITLKKGTIAKKVAMDKVLPYTKYINEFEYTNYTGGSKFQNGDTIMARITPCLENGKTAFIDFLDENEVGFGSTEFIVLRERKGISDAQYIYYLSISPQFRKIAISSMVGSSGRQRVQQSVLDELELFVPDINEQRRIANILNKIDEKIRINNRINDNLEKQLHQLFLYFFTNCIPSVALGDIVETTSGGTPSRKHIEYYKNGTICWVKSKELLSNYIHNTEEHISDLALSKSSAKLLPKHSVLIAMYGATVGAYGIISRPMACNQAVCALLCNEKYPYTYLFQIAKEFQQKLVGMAVGSAQQNISQVLIKQLHLHSDIDTINNFHILAYPLHKKIEYLQAENIILGKTRDAILSKLMSGEIDVSNIDI